MDVIFIRIEIRSESGMSKIKIKPAKTISKRIIFYFMISPQKRIFFTGEIYDIYTTVCKKIKQNVLTQRRISDILAKLDMLGIINVRVISKGRGGRMREIKLAISKEIMRKAKEIINESLNYG